MQGRLYLLSDIALVTDIGISNLGFNHTIQCKQLNICLHVLTSALSLHHDKNENFYLLVSSDATDDV